MLKPMVLLLLLASACSSIDPIDETLLPEEILPGTWQRVINQAEVQLTISADGAYSVSYNTTLAFEGDYEYNANAHLVVQDMGCGTFAGTYSLTFTESQRSVILGMVEDNCQFRGDRWRGTWTRVGESN